MSQCRRVYKAQVASHRLPGEGPCAWHELRGAAPDGPLGLLHFFDEEVPTTCFCHKKEGPRGMYVMCDYT